MNGHEDQAYGALVEGVHLAGYSLERAFRKLEWLLEEDRWKSVGEGFDDINVFLDTIKLDMFRIVAADRKRMAERIKQLQPDATQDAIGNLLGADQSQISRDLNANASASNKKPSNIKDEQGAADANASPPPGLKSSGPEAAKAAERSETKDERQAAKQEARAQKEAELGSKILAMPQKKYGVIYADPPWKFEPYSVVTGMDRAADNHYPTMTLDDIVALSVPAADDAVLFLWATMPMLREAFDVMDAWEFEYKSGFIWIKDRIGTGYWTRNKHELLLIGTRGNVPAPAMGTQYPSAIDAPLGAHSAKPFRFREMIEEMFPTMPRIELFARETFEGWDRWGYEAA